MNFPENLHFHRYRPAAWLRVSGPDAPSFLQGQFSNDLRSVKAEEAIYGLWLNHKGKVIADSFVMQDDEGVFWIGSVFSGGDTIRRHLEDHLVADEVTVEDLTGNWEGVALMGEGAEAWLRSSPRGGRVFRGRRGVVENWEWIFPSEAAASAIAQLPGGRGDPEEEMEKRRIGAGIPRVPADLGPADLPHEGGLGEDAISYSKGCYVGQEVMARLKSGRIRRRLIRVEGPGPVPSLPSPLFQDGRKAGELRTAVPDGSGRFSGLALLTLLNLTPGAPLSLSVSGEPSVSASK